MAPTKDGSRDSGWPDAGPMHPIEVEVARGLRFSHMMITATAGQDNESLAVIQALVRALVARGIATEKEWARALEEARQEVGEVPTTG